MVLHQAHWSVPYYFHLLNNHKDSYNTESSQSHGYPGASVPKESFKTHFGYSRLRLRESNNVRTLAIVLEKGPV